MFRKVIIFFFLKFISTNNPSMSFGKLCFVKSLLWISILRYISMPTPFQFWPSWKVKEKPSVRKLDVANISSSFVSANANTSTWFEIRHFNWWHFPGMGLMYRFPMTTCFGFFSLTFLRSHIWSKLFGALEFPFLFKLLFHTVL